jgi:hypothetical protein
MNTTALADDSAVATDTPPTWSELIARRLADVVDPIEDEADDPGTSAGFDRTVEQGGRSGSVSPEIDRRWVLVAPLAGAIALTAASSLVEPNPLRTGASASGLLAFAVLIPFFLVCVAGTLALVRDAARLRDAEADWSPNPWHYVAPSAVALAALHAYRVGWRVDGVEEAVGLVVGSLVVALAASSILAGPAYLLARRRRLTTD